MSGHRERRRRRRSYLDAGDGITVAVSHRGQLDPRTADAFRRIGRAAFAQLDAGDHEIVGADHRGDDIARRSSGGQ